MDGKVSRKQNDIYSDSRKFWNDSTEHNREFIIFKALCNKPVESRMKTGLVYCKLSAEHLEERDPETWGAVAAFINGLKI